MGRYVIIKSGKVKKDLIFLKVDAWIFFHSVIPLTVPTMKSVTYTPPIIFNSSLSAVKNNPCAKMPVYKTEPMLASIAKIEMKNAGIMVKSISKLENPEPLKIDLISALP